jgi:hypothetical protein
MDFSCNEFSVFYLNSTKMIVSKQYEFLEAGIINVIKYIIIVYKFII